MSDTTGTQSVRAWDLPTRLFHWLLVILIASAWISFEYSEVFNDPTLKWHRYNGYAVLVLIVWRLMWGVVGPHTVQFRSFVTGPSKALAFGRAFLARNDPHYLGHNPVAGYAIIAMMGIIGVQGFLGLMSEEHNATTWGPLFFLTSGATREWVTKTHTSLFYYGLLALIAIHVWGAVVHDVFRREGITKAMVTGDKPKRDFVDGEGLTESATAGIVRALVCLVLAIAIVFGGILLAGGRLFY